MEKCIIYIYIYILFRWHRIVHKYITVYVRELHLLT